MPDESKIQTIWRLSEDPYVMARWDRYIRKGFGVKNITESYRSALDMCDNYELPTQTLIDEASFLTPYVKFPDDGFAPDWFSFGGFDFCSLKMADALAQPANVIQYLNIHLDCAGEIAKSKHYRLVHIIAHQPAIDLQKSDYEPYFCEEISDNYPMFNLGFVKKYVLPENFVPQSEIFRVEEDPVIHILATDSLAERVLKTGCTGLRFVGLDGPDYAGGRPFTIRTARGTKIVTR